MATKPIDDNEHEATNGSIPASDNDGHNPVANGNASALDAPDPPLPLPPQKQKGKASDKNIHVPKDKKLKIESVKVKEAISDNDIIFYDIHVKTAQNRWIVRKRYSEFEDLHNLLIKHSKASLPVLPPKHYKFFTDHADPKFIEQRRALLDNYVGRLIKLKEVSCMQPVVNFFHDSKAIHITEQTKHDSNGNEQDNDNLDNGNSKHDRNDNANENESTTHANDNSEEKKNNDENNIDKLINDSLSPNAKIVVKCQDDYEFPSDQEITHIEIQSLRKMSDHVLYQVLVKNIHREEPYDKWNVMKRFHNIYVMDQDIRKEFANDERHDLIKQMPLMPERKSKIIHDHMNEGFMEGRQVLLQNYFNKMLRIEEVAKSTIFLAFFGVEVD